MHVVETTVEAANGLANLNLWLFVMLTSLFTPLLFDKLGTDGTFFMYAICSLIGTLYLSLVTRDTSKVDEETGERVMLSEKEKKTLYKLN